MTGPRQIRNSFLTGFTRCKRSPLSLIIGVPSNGRTSLVIFRMLALQEPSFTEAERRAPPQPPPVQPAEPDVEADNEAVAHATVRRQTAESQVTNYSVRISYLVSY